MRARAEVDDGEIPSCFNVCQLLRQGYGSSLLVMDIFGAVLVEFVRQRFAAYPAIVPDLMCLNDAPNGEDDDPL